MILRVERHNSALPPAQRIRTSVEVEKPRDELLPLLAHGDVVRPGHAHLATPRRRLVRLGGGEGPGGSGRGHERVWLEKGSGRVERVPGGAEERRPVAPRRCSSARTWPSTSATTRRPRRCGGCGAACGQGKARGRDGDGTGLGGKGEPRLRVGFRLPPSQL